MEKKFLDFENADFHYGDAALCRQANPLDGQSDLYSSAWYQSSETPDLLRKSMERFLIGNVV